MALGDPLLSPERHYVITVQGGTLNGAAASATNYIISAAPASALVGTGLQIDDLECTQFRLDSNSVKAASGSLGIKCWKQ